MKTRERYAMVFTTLLLLGSCAKEQGFQWEEDSLVSFSPSMAPAVTKADDPLPTNIHFGVFGFYQEGVAGDPGTAGAWSDLATKNWTPEFMYNVDVFYSGSAYTYSPAKQWPSDEINTLTFWAYAPYSSTPDLLKSGTNNSYDNTSVGLPDVRFTVTDGSEDLLFSELEEDMDKTDGTVQFLFHHALSQIRFFVKKVDATSKYTVNLTSARLDGVKMTAVHRSSGWTDYGSTTGSITLVSASQVLGTDYPGEPYATVMPLPQTFTVSEASLHLAYTVEHEDMLTPRTIIRDIPLKDIFTENWIKENQYSLYIYITPHDPIEFTVTWSAWGDVTNFHISS